MLTEIHWLEGPWPGKLALAARPRGGDWLGDEVASWKQAGVNAVFSLLTSEEEQDLELSDEAGETREQGLEFSSFPIPDRQVPPFEEKLGEVLDKVQSAALRRTECSSALPPGSGTKRSGCGMFTCEERNESRWRNRGGIGGARGSSSRNFRATGMDRALRSSQLE
jgi:hypothetical protein